MLDHMRHRDDIETASLFWNVVQAVLKHFDSMPLRHRRTRRVGLDALYPPAQVGHPQEVLSVSAADVEQRAGTTGNVADVPTGDFLSKPKHDGGAHNEPREPAALRLVGCITEVP